ncbi:MAG: sigma-E processing peptidase SpoIIGA [Bacilli bacterium]|nr:sigma-E processing peptidase SpoIIGA [Bacilli bacterium]
MRVYVDLVLLLNITMDLLLLLSVSIVLKRNVKFYRIVLGSITGGISIIFLFISLNNLSLFLFKMLISVLMVLITFSYKNIKYFFNNLLYLYLSSIILGGGIYLLDIQINYRNQGLMFINNGFGINLVVLVIVSPFIIYSYIKSMRKMKNCYSNFYKVDLYYKNKIYHFNAFLDTGNRLYDPYKKRPIVIANTNKITLNYEDAILVPYMTASGNSILKCVVADKLIIEKSIEVSNVLIGVIDNKLNIEGVNMLLHNDLIGGMK